MECVRNFNPLLYGQAHDLRGRTLCVPLTCDVAVVDETISVLDYVENVLEDVTVYQFLMWNKCLHRSSTLGKRETVCVGPHRGRYTATVTAVATQTEWTTTA